MLAASAGRREICLLLLAEGADPSATTTGDRTASDLAARSGHDDLAAALRPERTRRPPAYASASLAGRDEDITGWSPEADGWESEIEFSPASGDAAVAQATRNVQHEITLSRVENDDADWLDTELSLPTGRVRPVAADTAATIARIAACVAAEQVSPARLGRITGRMPGLGHLAEDLGIRIGTPFERQIARDMGFAREDAATRFLMENLEEALEALSLARDGDDIYAAELARLPAVDREAEQSMFRGLGEAKRQVIRSIIACLPLVENVIAGTPKEAGDDGRDETDADPETDGDAASTPTGDGLHAALMAVQDANWNADIDHLASFDLDLRLVSDVRRALADARDDTGAADRLAGSVDRYVAIRNRVVEANLPLVTRYASRYRRPGVLVADLVQEANISLIRAVERFDVSRGYRFATFAIWWIRQSCGRANEELSRTIRLPVHITETCVRIMRVRDRLAKELGRTPELHEIAAGADVPAEKVRRLIPAWRRTISISDARLGGYSGRIADVDTPSAWEESFSGERRRILARALSLLPERQERIIRSRFGLSGYKAQTLEEVGDSFMVTRERIRQLEQKSLAALGRPVCPTRRLLRNLL
jgi:RNA polymerase sigma factor (sigma-70 family)